MALSDEQLVGLETKYGKIGVIEFSGHTLVFKKPDRVMVRDYRRKLTSPDEKMDAADQLAQACIVAFDGELDPNKARMVFTMSFLNDYPMFTNTAKYIQVFNVLLGLVETQDVTDMGKGCSIRGIPPQTSPQA